MSTSSIEERMARLEGSYEQIERRLSTLEQDMRAGFAGVENRFARMEDRIESRFRWLLGTTLGMWATVLAMWITVILAIMQRG
jgi:hypothetical protein